MITGFLYEKMPNFNMRGAILFIVIGVIMVVSVLAAAILKIISNQSRLTHHQVSRIQSQYAAKAGLLYALDKLRMNDSNWPSAGTYTKRMCREVAVPDCITPDITEADLPTSINYVDITVYDVNVGPGPLAGTRRVSATANYTYTP